MPNDIYHEDPFQKIVNVHWRRGGFAVFAVQSGGNSAGGVPAFELFANDLPLGEVFGSFNTKYAHTIPVYTLVNDASFTSSFSYHNIETFDSTFTWNPTVAWIEYEEETPALAQPYKLVNWDGVGNPQFNAKDVYESPTSNQVVRGATEQEVFDKFVQLVGALTGPYRMGVTVGPFIVTTQTAGWEAHAIVIIDLEKLRAALGVPIIEFHVDELTSLWDAQMFTFRDDPSSLLPTPDNKPTSDYYAQSVMHVQKSGGGEGGSSFPFFFIALPELTIT